MPIDLEVLGEAVWERRERLKMTQRQLADAAGLQQYQIQRAEYGTCDMRISTFAKLAEGLRISPASLLKKAT